MTGHVWLDVIISVAAALLLSWLALMVALAIGRPKGNLLKEALRLLPDLLRLLKRLTTDRTLPAGVRVRVALLFVYLAIPIDIIPDFVPVLGYADDAIIVVLVLRSVCRRISFDELGAAWPGTDDGFAALKRLVKPRTANRSRPPWVWNNRTGVRYAEACPPKLSCFTALFTAALCGLRPRNVILPSRLLSFARLPMVMMRCSPRPRASRSVRGMRGRPRTLVMKSSRRAC
jgi:uncharacterized membrane protein YkvA (DUF1232 family)